MCVPEGGHAVARWPAHDEAPLWVSASFTNFLHAAGRPHFTHADLGLHFEMSGRPAGNTVYRLQLLFFIIKSIHLIRCFFNKLFVQGDVLKCLVLYTTQNEFVYCHGP